MKTIEVMTNITTTKTVEVIESFDLFNHVFVIHKDISFDLFVCTHEKSKRKLPVYADTLKEIKDASIALLLYKGKRRLNNELKQIK